MLEKEAASKWCPFARQMMLVGSPPTMGKGGVMLPGSPAGVVVGNRFQQGQIAPCMGSNCMAWRWEPKYVGEDRHGHCGLVGHPDAPAGN